MITVRFEVSGDEISGFSVSGHSGYGEEGNDIVCSAVSSAAYMAANTITDILLLNPEIQEKDGFLSVKLNSGDGKSADIILKGFELHIKELSKLYPNYIKVERGAK